MVVSLFTEPNSAPCMVFEFMPFGDLTEVLRCSSKNPWAPPRPGLPPLTQVRMTYTKLNQALKIIFTVALLTIIITLSAA